MSRTTFELENIVVRAGAGAGKTTALTERVLGLAEGYIEKHNKEPHFIVTTFTRKATQELRERLLSEALKRKSSRLVEFVQKPSCLHISTIHGVLGLFLSRYGASIGLSPQLRIISEVQERQMLKKLIRVLTQKNPEFCQSFQNLLEIAEFSDLLAAFQNYVEIHLKHPNLSFATQNDFEEILKARLSLVKQLAQECIEQIHSGTDQESWLNFAGFIKNRILPLCGSISELKSLPAVMNDWKSPKKTKDLSETLPELRDGLKKKLESLDSFAFSSDFFELHSQVSKEFKICGDLIAQEILRQKLELGQLTMSDLENMSLYLIHRDKLAAQAFAKDWNYWLIDEYQDTSPIQVKILDALIHQTQSFKVGDPQQSIYLFRGARSEVFLEQEKQIAKQGGKALTLMKNYRSRPELLLFFNDFFTQINSQFQAMEPGPGPKHRGAEIEAAHIYILPEPEDLETDPEVEAVIERCFELQSQGVSLEKICVLGRTNKKLDEIALRALERGLSVQVHTSGDFFERREVLDAMALLKFLVNPHDNLNFLECLRSPFFRIKDNDILKFSSQEKTENFISFWSRALSHAADMEPLRELSRLLQLTHKIGIGEAWVQGLLQNAYFDLSYRIDPTGRREANLWKLISLIRQEERKPGFNYLSFLRSKEQLENDTEAGGESDAVPVIEPKRVNLMTVHASKGLQFDYVILPHMGSIGKNASSDFFMFEEKSEKWTLSLPDPEDGKKTASLLGLKILEERKLREKSESERVLYVALTRAILNVTLIWTENAKSESWADKAPIKKIEGVHSHENYSYKVIKTLKRKFLSEGVLDSEVKTLEKWKSSISEKFKTVSVTEILESSAGREEKAIQRKTSDAAVDSIQKAIKGVDVHRILEAYKYLYVRDPEINWQDYNRTLKSDAKTAFSYVMTDQKGRWKSLIESGEVEWGFGVMSARGLIQGQIDLWGVIDGIAYVVDYKTGSPFHKEKAFQQLEIYSWALLKMKKLDPHQEIQLVVIYPYSGLTEMRPSAKLTAIDSVQDT